MFSQAAIISEHSEKNMNLSFAYIVSFFTQAYKMFCFVALRVASNTLTAYIISNHNKAGGRGLVRVDPKFKT